jgi:putative restriction endonuclease
MAYWWVNHKGTHAEEIGGGYIWSPKTVKTGAYKQTYVNLTLVRPGDVVFSYAFKAIQAVGVVQGPHREVPKPQYGQGARESWAATGWLVPIQWTPLEHPFEPKPYYEQLKPLLPATYSPLDKNGKGTENCYLAAIDPGLYEALMALMAPTNPELPLELVSAEATREILESDMDETKKKQLVDARDGQGLFKARVTQLEPKCRVSGTADRRVLVASHVKPWAVCDHRQRLDGYNGLLLAPHVDRLFDRFLISFQDDGQLITAGPAVDTIMKQWGLNPTVKTPALRAGQRPYMAYHRQRLLAEVEKAQWK